MVRFPNGTEEMKMETISKVGFHAMVVAAVASAALTWAMSRAFIESTAVARWVDAAQVASQVVASTAEVSGASVKAAALLK